MSKQKSLSKLKEQAREAFNKWVRNRDAELPCISCGKFRTLQAGHYVPEGKSSYLRYNEWNVNGECAGCNCFDAFHLVGYRKNLIERIGIVNVEWLEENRFILHSWDREQLNFIIKKYSL